MSERVKFAGRSASAELSVTRPRWFGGSTTLSLGGGAAAAAAAADFFGVGRDGGCVVEAGTTAAKVVPANGRKSECVRVY